MKDTLTNHPYISLGKQHKPTITNRRISPAGEVLRIYFDNGSFMFVVKNKKKVMAGYADAKNMVRVIKNKYPKSKVCDLQFVYPEGFKNEARVISLTNEHVDEQSFEKYLYKYLLCLI